jgi:hypothetical protein
MDHAIHCIRFPIYLCMNAYYLERLGKKKVMHSNITASDTDNKEESRKHIDSSKRKIPPSASSGYASLIKQQQKYAILVIDMINDFVKGKLKCERAARIIPNVKALVETARQKEIPVFHCIDEHLPTDTYEMNLWGPHAMKDSEGARIIDELKPLN